MLVTHLHRYTMECLLKNINLKLLKYTVSSSRSRLTRLDSTRVEPCA